MSSQGNISLDPDRHTRAEPYYFLGLLVATHIHVQLATHTILFELCTQPTCVIRSPDCMSQTVFVGATLAVARKKPVIVREESVITRVDL